MPQDQVESIARERRTTGAAISPDGADIDQWRRNARAAARTLGRPVETIAFDGRGHAALKDFPRNELEEAVSQARRRRAIVGVGANIATVGNEN